jgi:hypothetical protein
MTDNASGGGFIVRGNYFSTVWKKYFHSVEKFAGAG